MTSLHQRNKGDLTLVLVGAEENPSMLRSPPTPLLAASSSVTTAAPRHFLSPSPSDFSRTDTHLALLARMFLGGVSGRWPASGQEGTGGC